MNSRLPIDFLTPEERKHDLRVKIAQTVRQMNRYITDYGNAETVDEKNFFAHRIGMKQDLLDCYNKALALLEQD